MRENSPLYFVLYVQIQASGKRGSGDEHRCSMTETDLFGEKWNSIITLVVVVSFKIKIDTSQVPPTIFIMTKS